MLREHGFERSNIITMIYDDIAQNVQNPYKGNVINKPRGANVYSADIDYRGSAVTAANFLKILSGNKAAIAGIGSGRVVESSADDNIFLFFSDHGAPGVIAFPVGGHLHARDLVDTLKKMKTDGKFNEVLFYLEACESGSMFNNLLGADSHVFAATAANPTESSWACYWDNDRNAYLGDTFAVTFLEDSDKVNMSSDTVQAQFERVRAATTESHAMQYGDLTIGREKIDEFLVARETPFHPVFLGNRNGNAEEGPSPTLDQVSARDIKLATLLRVLPKLAPGTPEHAQQLADIDAELAHRTRADRQAAALAHVVAGTPLHELRSRRLALTQRSTADCLAESVDSYEKFCGAFSDYSMAHIRSLAHLCETGASASQIARAAKRVCRA